MDNIALADNISLGKSSTNAVSYEAIVEKEYEKILDVSLTPSDIISNETSSESDDSAFLQFGIKRAVLNKKLK
jgi:hypothetical protein